MRHARVLLSATAVLLAACGGSRLPPFPVSPAGGADSAATLVLEPGDVVRLQVFGRTELSGDYPVDENNNLLLPLLGEMSVRNVPVPDLRRTIREQFGRLFTQAYISVTPLFRIGVLGEVGRPGLFSADPTMTVYDLLALAGGTQRTARSGDLRFIRGGRAYSLRMDTDALASATLRELGVRSGDQLIVPRRSITNEEWLIILQLTSVALLAYSIFR